MAGEKEKPETLGTSDSQRIELERQNGSLRKSLDDANKRVAELQAQIATAGIPEELKEMVKIKMAAGLPQVDAIESARVQYEYDLELAAKEKAAKAKPAK